MYNLEDMRKTDQDEGIEQARKSSNLRKLSNHKLTSEPSHQASTRNVNLVSATTPDTDLRDTGIGSRDNITTTTSNSSNENISKYSNSRETTKILTNAEIVHGSGKYCLPSKENVNPRDLGVAGNTEWVSAEAALGKEDDPPPQEFVRRGSLPLNHGVGTGMTLRHKRTQSIQKVENEQDNVNISR